ncbi:hypothetical protein [Candidatus Magnetominusculus dajiuhuensis]|uniref:hypothetical protein n=1 Tax=Candidatus Magnetominusculus dajiuhuensis TaxID=3137712 RepID=UPI003B428BC6
MSYEEIHKLIREKEPLASAAAQPKETDFVKASDGTYDFGHITPEIGQAIGRQSAPVRLQEGNVDYGKQHIDTANDGKRLEAIKKAGYAGTADFIHDVASNYTEIRKGYGSRLVLVKKNGGNKISIVQLLPGEDGDFYGVTTGGIFSRKYIEKFALLEGSAATIPPIRPERSNPLPNANADEAQDTSALRERPSNATTSTIPKPRGDVNGKG